VANFTAGTSFTDGVTNDVTAAKLNALVADAVPTANLSLNSTTGTISNFTASTANITLGTIPTLTAGTTTGTAGIFTSGTITTGLIPTLTVGTTTSTAGIFTSGTITTGVIPTLTTGTTTSTNEVVTNGTITNLSATTSTFLGAITASTAVINVGSGQIYKDASGRVGIGTTSPDASYRMTFSGSRSGVAPGIILTDSDATPTNYGLYINGSKSFTIWDATAGVNRLLVDSSGNVGVGTASPTRKLDVSNGSIRISDDQSIEWGGATNFILGSTASNYLRFYTNNTERLRIDSSGNCSIGTATALSKLHVHGDVTLSNTTTATTAATGGVSVPATAAGYLTVSINGTSRKIPYYA